MRVFASVTLGFLLGLIIFAFLQREHTLRLAVLAGLAAWLAPVLLALFFPAQNQSGQVHIDDEAITVDWGGRKQRFPFASLDMFEVGPRGLMVGAGGQVAFLSTDAMRSKPARAGQVGPQEDAGQVLVADLGARIRNHPRYGDILARSYAREQRARQFAQRPMVVIRSVGVLMGVGFGLELLTGALEDPAAMLRLGANQVALVGAGEVHRLVVASFLHGGLMHFFMNGSALFSLGSTYERWAGARRLGLLLFVSGVCGQLFGALGTQSMVVGMSTAIYGLLGGAAVTSVWYRHHPLDGPRIDTRSWIWLLAVNGAINLIPGVSVAGHAGGLLGGLLVAWLVFPRPGRPPRLPDLVVTPLSYLALAATVAAIVATLIRALPLG